MVKEAGLTRIRSANIFDLGCGTGAVEAEIYAAVPKEQWADIKVLAGDVSQSMLDYLDKRGESEGWTGIETRLVDGKELEKNLQEEGFSHVFVGFTIFLLPPDTIKKLARRLKSGGALGISTWASMPWYELFTRAFERVENGPKMPSREMWWASFTYNQPWNEKEFVNSQLEEVGLKKVETVQRKFEVECGTPDIFITSVGYVLGILSKPWAEDVRERWLKEIQEILREILVEEAGGVDQPVFMTCEGIVGVGWKEE